MNGRKFLQKKKDFHFADKCVRGVLYDGINKENETAEMERGILMKKFITRLCMLLAVIAMCIPAVPVKAAAYGNNYKYWSQGGSDYSIMRDYGCWIVAQSKLLYETGIERSASFNPDSYFLWEMNNGLVPGWNNINQTNGGNAPVIYANQKGKSLQYLGYWDASDNQLWYNINAGYYTILFVGHHYVLIDNATSKATGRLYCYDSFSDRGTVSQQLITRYNQHCGGYVYKADGAQAASNVSYTDVKANWTDTRNAELNGDIQNPGRGTIEQVGAYVWDPNGSCVVDHTENCGLNYSRVNQKLNIVNEAKPSGLQAGTTYTFQFWAKVNGRIYYSEKGSFRTQGTAPSNNNSSSGNKGTTSSKISNFKAVKTGAGKVRLTWNRISGANTYRLYCATSKNGSYQYIGSVSGNYCNIINMQPNRNWYFKVQAYSGSRSKASSGILTVNTRIGSVSGLKVSSRTKNSVTLQWKKRNDVSGYRIYRSTNRYFGYKLVKTTGANSSSWKNTGLRKKKNYYYKIVPVVKTGNRTYTGNQTGIKAKTR